MVPRGEVGVRCTGCLGLLEYKVLHLEWMGNEALMYSTGQCVRLGNYSVQQKVKKHYKLTIIKIIKRTRLSKKLNGGEKSIPINKTWKSESFNS